MSDPKPPAQGVDERRHHSRARRAEGVAERDGPSVDVHLRRVELQVAHAGDRLRRERFIQLPQIDLIDREPGALQRLVHRGNGTDSHH